MKTTRWLPLLFSLIILLPLIACKEKPKNPVAEYGGALMDSYQKSQQAGRIANLDAVRKTVAEYRASNGKYPESLEEIRDMFNSDIDLSIYDYDPQSGSVSIKN